MQTNSLICVSIPEIYFQTSAWVWPAINHVLWKSLVCLLQTRWLPQNSECNHEIRGRTAGSHRQGFSRALIIDHDFPDFSLCLKCAPFLVSLFNSPCKFVYQNNVRFSQVCHSKNTLSELSMSNYKNKYKDNNVS